MTSINPNLNRPLLPAHPAPADPAQRLRQSLQRLGAGAALRAPRADSVALSPTAASTAGAAARDALAELQALTLAEQTAAGAAPTDAIKTQREIDEILAPLKPVTTAGAASDVASFRPTYDFQVSNTASFVQWLRIDESSVEPGRSLDIQVDVKSHAQAGALFLSLGAEGIPLGSNGSRFRIEVAGIRGVQEFAITSGSTVYDLASIINLYSLATGVRAVTSGYGEVTGFRLISEEVGAAQFVNVRVLDDGDVESPPSVGIYRLQPDDHARIDPTSRIAFDSAAAAAGHRDYGIDASALINGAQASTIGSIIFLPDSVPVQGLFRINTPGFDYFATGVVSFRAFTITGVTSYRPATPGAPINNPTSPPAPATAPPQPPTPTPADTRHSILTRAAQSITAATTPLDPNRVFDLLT